MPQRPLETTDLWKPRIFGNHGFLEITDFWKSHQLTTSLQRRRWPTWVRWFESHVKICTLQGTSTQVTALGVFTLVTRGWAASEFLTRASKFNMTPNGAFWRARHQRENPHCDVRKPAGEQAAKTLQELGDEPTGVHPMLCLQEERRGLGCRVGTHKIWRV